MRKRDWRVYGKKADFDGLAKQFNISPYTARIIRNRGALSVEDFKKYLSNDYSGLYSPHLMTDIDKAAGILFEKIKTGKLIRIIGDYDIDGVCSIAILYRGIKELNGNVDWKIPHRIKDGYGLNMSMVEGAVNEGTVDTILTCDNGISAAEPVEYARKHGLCVIITDHHAIPPTGLLEADAVVNPHQEGDKYPWPDICGAVVALKLIQVLYELAGFDKNKYLELIEFAAMATVGDVMNLKDENRLIVRIGLSALHSTKYIGIIALCEACKTTPQSLTSYHLGFVTGPALNAGGRLESAELSARLLLTKDYDEACELANRLSSLNEERKSMTLKNLEESKLKIETSELKNDKVLVLYNEECHESIAGIVAGKLREEYYKPSIVLTKSADGLAKGSARSIEGYHMSDSLAQVRELLTKFGGHPMAAGMSLPVENIDAFRKALNDNCKLTEQDMIEKLWIDIAMPISCITMNWIKELSLLEPFGMGNEKPRLAYSGLVLEKLAFLGKSRNYLKLYLREPSGYSFEALMFSNTDDFLKDVMRKYGTQTQSQLFIGRKDDNNPVKLSVLYEPGINEFRGVESVQIIIKDYLL